MGNPIAARRDGILRAVSTAPSFNKTPVGASTPPLPYPTLQDLSNSVGVVPTVRLNGKPAYVLGRSTQPSGKGDAPGLAKGVKSGTVTGEVKPVKGSTTVRFGGKAAVRHGDPCTMNGGNNPGIYCTTQVPSAVAPKGSTRAKVVPQTQEEESFLDKAKDSMRSVAKGYQDNVSQSLHDFAGRAMDKGGTIAAAGGGAALVGGGMIVTGIGAAPGAVIAAGGGTVAAVGGGVTAVGGIAETLATGADALASFVVSGKTPNAISTATAYAERMVLNKVDRVVGLIPGMKGKAKKAVDDAKEALEKSTKKKPAASSDNKKPGPAGDGTTVQGDGKDGGRCKLRPYRELQGKCPGGGTPHHVVPDHCFKGTGSGAYYPGGIPHADGMSICVSGAGKFSKPDGKTTKRVGKPLETFMGEVADHGKIHVLMDAAEEALGQAGDPKHTATLGQLEKAGATTVGSVTGCDPADLERQLRDYHESKGLKKDSRWRADPFGNAKTLSRVGMGRTSMGSGPSGRP